MMKCPNCNHEIEIEAAFCPACGTRLADSEQMAAPQTKDQTPARPPKVCSRRGAVLALNGDYACGHRRNNGGKSQCWVVHQVPLIHGAYYSMYRPAYRPATKNGDMVGDMV